MRFMNGSSKKLLFLAATGMSLFPAPVMAQDASGKFTLTKEVRWGLALLPPGNYSYSIERHAAETILLRSSRGGQSAIVLAASVSTFDPPGASRLVLQQQDGEWFVSSMVLGDFGEELHFTPPSKDTGVTQDGNLHHAKLSALSNP
jgi:hypothetical protein